MSIEDDAKALAELTALGSVPLLGERIMVRKVRRRSYPRR